LKILFDQGTPLPLRKHLHPHSVDTTFERGWSLLENGNLISAAVNAGYELFITTDQNIKHQHNLEKLEISILVLKTTSWPKILNQVNLVIEAVNGIPTNTLQEVLISL
jgi:hypothetical protein